MFSLFKKKIDILKLILCMMMIILITECHERIYTYYQEPKAETVDNKINNDSIFVSEMLDHHGQILSSRHIVYNSNEEYKLIIKNTDTDVIAYKLMLLIDGLQYDLSEDDIYSNALLLKAEGSEISTYIDFSRVNAGHHFGIFIIEKVYVSPRKILTPEVDMRFSISKSAENLSLETVQSQLKVSNSDNTALLSNMSRCIEFAAFHSQDQPPYEIRQNNIVSQDILPVYDLYLYNPSPFEANYWIGVIFEGEVITNALNSDYIISLASHAETVVQVTLTDINIAPNTQFYFIAIPNPQLECDPEPFDLALEEGRNIFTLFSQKFINAQEM